MVIYALCIVTTILMLPVALVLDIRDQLRG